MTHTPKPFPKLQYTVDTEANGVLKTSASDPVALLKEKIVPSKTKKG